MSIFLSLSPSILVYSSIAAYYIIFLSFDNPNTPEGVDDSINNPMPSPMESIMAMFLMSLTNFGDYYSAFERTQHEMEAKVQCVCSISRRIQSDDLKVNETFSQFLFVLYMAIVAILLVNMLIAMMGNTYQKIAETRNEWQRQVSPSLYLISLSLRLFTSSSLDLSISSVSVGAYSSSGRARCESRGKAEKVNGLFPANVGWSQSISTSSESIGNVANERSTE